jgi:arginyl-tRNA synthetase
MAMMLQKNFGFTKTSTLILQLIFSVKIMLVANQIQQTAHEALKALYGVDVPLQAVQINTTKPEFEGDYTVVTFGLLKHIKAEPLALGEALGAKMLELNKMLSAYNVIKGFLNLTVSTHVWAELVDAQYQNTSYGQLPSTNKKVMVEYSSPNTNKPLHLGHLRNNFLGYSVTKILEAAGNEVVTSCIVNDRGVHICKSMIAWQRFANGATPETTGTKGDHFVGDYYVKFNDAYKTEVDELVATGMDKAQAEKEAPIMKATQQMLLDWENGDEAVMQLWRTMNGWVYQGFDETYKTIGTSFDKIYYESNTYLLGKQTVDLGLEKGIFVKRPDGSVWIDLTADGLDEKLVLRKDGTSVYITQDLGLAQQKYDEYKIDSSIYVIGNEQDYHMKVLKLICEKYGLPYAKDIHHLSYGMVELPTGKMKSREGTVVDADDLVEEMKVQAAQRAEESVKGKDFTAEEKIEINTSVALGALKFFLLKVDPKKKMVFNPEESIDMQGFTGPFVQYAHARMQSILRKTELDATVPLSDYAVNKEEHELIVHLEQYPAIVAQAAAELNPSVVAIYVFQVAKLFNTFYNEHSISNASNEQAKNFRIKLCMLSANVLSHGLSILGIAAPSKM